MKCARTVLLLSIVLLCALAVNPAWLAAQALPALVEHPPFYLPWPHDYVSVRPFQVGVECVSMTMGPGYDSPQPAPSVADDGACARLSQAFHPNSAAYQMDFTLRSWTPVLAVADGRVTTSKCDPDSRLAGDPRGERCQGRAGLGWVVKIDHPARDVAGEPIIVRSVYAHLAQPPVFGSFDGSVSIPVKRGNVIGYVGGSGNAQGDHLHFELQSAPYGRWYYPRFEECDGCTPGDDRAYRSANVLTPYP